MLLDFSAGAGFHRRNYHDLTYVVGLSNADSRPVADIDFTRTMLPMMFGPTIKISLLEMNLPNLPGIGWTAKTGVDKVTSLKDTGLLLRPYASYTMLWSDETNSTLGVSEERKYQDWGWGGEIGIYFTTDDGITSIISVLYNHASVERTKGVDESGLPNNREVKLNGVGFLLTMGFEF
jgi:hypothetical protein